MGEHSSAGKAGTVDAMSKYTVYDCIPATDMYTTYLAPYNTGSSNLT